MNTNIINIAITILASIVMGVLVLFFHVISIGILFVLFINILIFVSPRHFILFWLIVAGFSSAIHLPGGITSYGAMNLLFLPSLFLKIIFDYQKEIFKFPIIKFYSAFLIIYFISIWYSPVLHSKCFRQYWTFVIPLFMAIIITGSFRDTKTIEKYVRITLTFVALMCFLSTIMFFSGRWKISVGIDRASGFFDHPNLYAMFLNFHFGISLTLAMFLVSKKDQLFYYIISLILCLSLVPTFSKGAYISCFLIFFLLSILSIKTKRKGGQVFILLAFVSLLVLFGFIFFHTTLMRRFSNEDTLIWRLNLWQGLWGYVMHRPILGYGFLSNHQIAGDVLDISEGFSTHSQYFEILLDVGIIGLIAFLGSYLGMLLYAFRFFLDSLKNSFNKAFSLGFVISIVVILFHSFSESAFYIPMVNLYLWFYFAFLVALVNIEKSKATKL